MNTLHTKFDRAETLGELVECLRTALNAAGTLVTQVTTQRQFVLANSGVHLPPQFATSMPISHSICQHPAAMDFPLVIDDAFSHPLLIGNMAVSELHVAAYLGAPVHVQQGKAMGAICAIEMQRRRWSDFDIEMIACAAEAADRLMVRTV